MSAPAATAPATAPPLPPIDPLPPGSALEKLLEETTLDELTGPKTVVILKDTATVEQALRTLASRRILSAPVVAAPEGSAQTCGCLGPLLGGAPPGAHWPQDRGLESHERILGFLDVRDVLSSFLAEIGGSAISRMKMLQRMRLLEEKGAAFALTAVKDLKVFGGDGDFLHTSEAAQSTLRDVIVNGFLNPKDRPVRNGTADATDDAPATTTATITTTTTSTTTPGVPTYIRSGSHSGRHIVSGTVHRAAVYDSQFRLLSIVSQTDIIKFIAMNRHDLGALADRTALELGWASRPVVALGPDVSAIEAMALMNERQISAVAVVDGVGKIIGNFSVSEMRTIMAEHFGALALPVGEFLALEHGTEFQGYSRIADSEVVASAGHKFITDRVSRTRPRTPGEEVGQALVLVKPEDKFVDIVHKIVSHRIHRVYVVDAQERPCGLVTCTDVLKLVMRVLPGGIEGGRCGANAGAAAAGAAGAGAAAATGATEAAAALAAAGGGSGGGGKAMEC